MTLIPTEILNDVKYPSVELWMKKKESHASWDFYKYYLEHSEYKLSKAEWREMLKAYTFNFYNYLANGGIFLLPFFLGEMLFQRVKVNGKQVNYNASKNAYTEATGVKWQKGMDLTPYLVYHNVGATAKETFNLKWDKRSANCQHLRYWTIHISSKHQWKRILKMYTEQPGLLQKLQERTTIKHNGKNRQRTELHS